MGPPSYKLVCWNCWRVVLEAFLTTLELSDLNLLNTECSPVAEHIFHGLRTPVGKTSDVKIGL